MKWEHWPEMGYQDGEVVLTILTEAGVFLQSYSEGVRLFR